MLCAPPVDKDDSRASLALLNYGQFIVYDIQTTQIIWSSLPGIDIPIIKGRHNNLYKTSNTASICWDDPQ